MSCWLRTLLLAVSLFVASPATLAQQPAELERAKASFKAGANAYAAGDYLAAIQALERAYEISPLPAIAFSLAQAERKQYFVKEERAHLERALTLFRRYLEQEPRGARREDARLAITQLEPLLKRGVGPSGSGSQSLARPTRLMIVSDAPGARITLDGGAASASPLIREVQPGLHRARVEAEGYLDAERQVTAIAGELLLTEVSLTERPSSLHVWAPEASDVYVDGVYVAAGGGPVIVPLAAGRHQLTVAQKGRRLVRRDVQLQRGRAHTELVTLELTTQRRISEMLFIGGGAALGVGLVLSAFAVRSENRAEDYLRLQNKGNVLAAQRVAYNATLVERTRYRTAAAVSVAGSLGMFITGLFLHELDQPRASVAPVPDGPSRLLDGSRASRRVVLTPVASVGDLGASLQVSF